MQNFTLFHPIQSGKLFVWCSTHISRSNTLYFISIAVCFRYIHTYPGLSILHTFVISVDMRQLTAKNKDCITPNSLFVCLLFVCLFVYLFICLFIYIKAVNSSPEETKIPGINEKTVDVGSRMNSVRSHFCWYEAAHSQE